MPDRPSEPGLLDHYVALQRPVKTRQPTGQIALEWETYANVWAGFQNQRMASVAYSEGIIGGKRAEQVRMMIRLRQRSDLLPGHRILWDDNQLFDVIGTINTFDLIDEMIISAVRVVT